MEKFALLDFLKAFESLTGKRNDKSVADNGTDNEFNGQAGQTPSPPPVPPQEQVNVMANVIARHEEIANRIRNKRSV